MSIIYTQEPSGKCPVQAEGQIDGREFYFRSRGGKWCLRIAPYKCEDVFHEKAFVHCEEYNGVMRDEPSDFHGHMVQFGAGWAEPDECKEFIERAAGVWRAQQ